MPKAPPSPHSPVSSFKLWMRGMISSKSNTGQALAMQDVNAGTKVDDKHHYSSKSYSSKLIFNLHDLWTSEQLCDVELKAGSYSVKAHRCVLAAASSYFQAMFTSDLMEQKQQVVALPTLKPHILAALLTFIYTGNVEVTAETVQDLLVAADMLQMPDVVVTSSNFLLKQLTPANAIGCYRFAEGHHLDALAQSVWQFLEQNFPEVAQEEEFLDLPIELLLRLLLSELLNISAEHQVLSAAVRWLSHKHTERAEYASQVLRCVRFPLLSTSVLAETVSQCSSDAVDAIKCFLKSPPAAAEGGAALCIARPRLRARKKIYVMGGARRELESPHRRSEHLLYTGLCLDTYTQEWQEMSPMGIGRVMPGVAVLGGKIFVVGGELESSILANGETYDPLEDEWSAITPMVVPRCEFGLCAHDGFLYAFGGWVGEGVGGTIERYDPNANTWAETDNLLIPRFSMGVVEHEGLIYLVGGCTDSQRHRSDLLSYNPVTRSWSVHARLPTPRSRLAVAILDGFLYAVGGTNKDFEVLPTVERYSFQEDKWQAMCDMTVARASPAIGAANNLLYVIGGDMSSGRGTSDFFRTQVTIQSVEVYNPRSNTWSDHPPLPESRSEAAAAVI